MVMGQNPDAGWSPKISYNRWLMDVSSLTSIYIYIYCKYDCNIIIWQWYPKIWQWYPKYILKSPKKMDVSSQIKHPIISCNIPHRIHGAGIYANMTGVY